MYCICITQSIADPDPDQYWYSGTVLTDLKGTVAREKFSN